MRRKLLALEDVTVTAVDSLVILTASIPRETAKGVVGETQSAIVCVQGRCFQFARDMAIGEAMDLETGQFVKLDLTRVM